MNADRALEILNAYGGDPRRWPDAERGALAALAASDAGVAAALAEALELDRRLALWATDVAPAHFDAGAIVASVPAAPAPAWRWFAGGAVAAALAAGLIVFGAAPPPVAGGAGPAATILARTAAAPLAAASTIDGGTADAGFAYVFTPTVDEDELI